MKHTLKLYFILTLIIFINHQSFGQSFLLNPDSVFRYFVGTTEPDPDWLLPEFDDSGWPLDTGIIGFGYGFEDVQIDPTASSFYIRAKFTVGDPSNISAINFFADFDDGYIAYLNGKEIVRVNIDKSVDRPAYNDTTTRSHAIQIYNWDSDFPVLGYYLDSALLDSCLVAGENILAVQVLNDSASGSDLQFLMALWDVTDAYYDYYDWAFRYKDQVELDSSTFPLVIVETDELGVPRKNIRRKAHMGIIDKGIGAYNRPDDSCNVYYGDVSMEVRGQSSSEYPKRSYRFEFIDEFERDSNVAILGLPADNDWILMGPFHDKAQFRNSMVFEMGTMLNGSYQPRTRFCELIYNGEFLGLYMLCENIKRGSNRVDIKKLKQDEITGIDLTGGYIIRYDKPNGSLQIAYPKEDKIQTEQEEYIRGFFSEYREVLRSRDFLDPVIGYKKYINDTSLVDYLIVNEITKNADSYLYSTYMYKDRDDVDPRVHFGPLWDYDLAFGNSIFQQGDLTYGWQFANGSNTRLSVTKLMQDTGLVSLFQERWDIARASCFHTDSLMAYIDSVANYLKPALERNYQVWPVIDEPLFWPNYVSTSYENEIWNIKNWMLDRLDWIDENINDIFYEVNLPPIEGTDIFTNEFTFSFEFYPNPFSEELKLGLNLSEQANLTVEVFDALGKLQYIGTDYMVSGENLKTFENTEIGALEKGIYLIRLSLDGEMAGMVRVVKQ